MSDASGTSVYLYYGVSGYPVYVGVTDRGTRRMHEHADSKPWWPLVTGCAIEHYRTREQALDREEYLIRSYRPAFNFQHNPDRGLSDEAKAAKCGGVPKIGNPDSQAMLESRRDIKERRRFFMSLTPEQRKVHPCVMCGMRPGHGRPMCAVCLTEDQAKRAVITARRAPKAQSLTAD